MPTNVRDPRTLITPDAFEISADLLGTPLARPWPRLWALLLDLALVGLLTAMFDDIALFVWGGVALLLLHLAFRKAAPGGRTPAVSAMTRTATGCLGMVILLGVAIAGLVVTLSDDEGGPAVVRMEGIGPDNEVASLAGGQAVRAGLAAATGRSRLAASDTEDEAEEAALGILRGLGDIDMSDDARLHLLSELTPPDVPWEDEEDEVYGRALARWRSEAAAPGDAAAPLSGTTEPDAPEFAVAERDVETMTGAEVLTAYADIMEAGGEDLASPRARALRRRAAVLVAEDTVGALRGRLLDARDSVESERLRRLQAEAELQERGNAFVELLADVWDQLGSAIGLWSLYFTVLLTLWNGQTVGKRVLGLRVLRLDGHPINWWAAFERSGGYVAGLATGLLGFAQVFWDPNRQCIHDKIVGTVVVDDRALRTPGAWEEAWTGGTGEEAK